MLNIQKRYVVDENNNRIAVEIDYRTFKKIEEIIEDHALYQLIREADDSGSLNLSDAKEYYQKLLDEDGNKI